MPARSFGEAPTFTEEDIETPDIDTNMATNILNTHDIMPPCHQDVVISGVSCRLPQSDNMEEFRDNLMNGVDMVTEDDSRWQPGMYGLPARSGKLKDLTRFDAAFFGVHPKQANSMDPQLRLLLEVTHEAIVDAGVNPESVRGSKTGVFIGASASESHEAWSADPDNTVGYSMTGCTRSMFANRLSYAFDFKGPSYSIDTACSSSLLALDQALHSIRSGQCDAAIVGGSNLCLKPTTALQFLKLGMLSPDGMCKSFDAEGNGYCRSEGIVVMYLQKEMTAKRVYCTLVHSKTNSDGSKQQGITFPSGEVQKSLLYDVYSEACINPSEVAYVEAHGTGTQAGDPQEVNSICDVFCKDRQGPLKIGSVKSNMGHSEPASGLAAVAKVIVAMEEKTIPGNLHYNTPNINIPGLVDGKLNVVDCDTKWDGGLVGVNSFGFGGSNVHSVLKSNSQHASQCESCEKRRLFLYSSRSEKGLKEVLEKVRKHPEDLSLHGLMNETAFMSPSSHPYRGFTVLNGSNHINIQKTSTESRPVWYVFAGMGTQWQGMGRQMMEVDTFKASIMKTDKVLRPYGIGLYDMLMIGDDGVFEDTVNSFVAIAAIQVALVDMLTRLGIRADGIVGHSVGELGCAYADGCLTAEETVLAAYWRGHCIQTAKLPPGGMAAVGLTWQEALDQCPPGVVPACHNAEDTVTISGPKESVSKFVLELKARQIFAKEVNSAGVAFHSYYMKGIAPTLKAALDKVITTPKLRTDRWISSSIPECNWSTDLARFSSAAYHVNNLVSPVLFQEALGRVPANAVVIEIAPHCLLQAILKRSLSTDCCIVGLMKRGHENNVEFCFSSLGRCYQNGVRLDPLRLCPPVTFPVPSGTPMVSPLVKWDHEQSWNVPTADMFIGGGGKSQSGCSFDFDMSSDSEDHYLIGHKIDGRVLFPATGYLVLAWKALAKMEGKKFDEMPILFEDVDIHRATILPEDGKIHFDVTVMPGTGNFEVMEGGSVTASGRVISPESIEPGCPTCNNNRRDYDLSTTDIYKELRLRGYDYGPTFQGIVGADLAGIHGELRWTGDWISYLDTMLQMTILSQPGAGLRLPTRMKSVAIDPVRHLGFVRDHGNGEQGISVEVDQYCDTCISGSVTILGLHATSAPRRHDYHQPITEKYSFIPSLSENLVKLSESMAKYVSACLNCSFKGLTELIEKHGNNGLKNKDHIKAVLYEAVEKGLEHVEDAENVFDLKEHGCLSLLKKIYELEYNEMFAKSILHLVESNFEMLSADCLLNYMASSEYLKPCLDLVIENVSSQNLKILEVTRSGMNEHVMPLLSSHPLIHTTYTMTVDKLEELESADFNTIKWSPEDVPPPSMKKAHLATACNVLHKQKNITTALCNIAECLEEGGFLLVQEVTQNFHLALPLDGLGADVDYYDLSDRSCSIYCTSEKWREIFTKQGFVVIYERSDSFISTMFLLRKCSQSEVDKQTLLHISELEFDWVEEMKRQMSECQTKPKGENLWLIADSSASGIVGMVNCLRQEPGGERIRCILNLGKQRIPDIHAAMEMLVQTDLVMNIYRKGQWGTFRHLPLQPACLQESEHAYVNVQTRGDLSSLKWIQSPLRHFNTEENSGAELCNVHFASLNFRDVMLATGKLPPDAIPGGLANQECMLGMEFSGTDGDGRRVMGLVPAKGLATTVDVRKSFLWPVPDTWSLEEAASVPVVYTTAYYALVVRGNIRHGNKVLIHSGSGGVGQAAISIALHYGCEVFTTVGSAEKREYLQSRFPELDDGHFFNSRNTAFEFGVLKATRGKGVDIVLNSLAEEKLQASLRVLAQHGRFLEIGKFDLSNNTSLGMSLFLKNISFHGILLDALFEEGNNDWEVVSKCLCDGIKSGAVQPLKTTKFGRSDVELAFRFMAQGKHIGKVVVQVREDTKMVARTPVPAVARSACDPQKCYIITGGLGGFGLELANWLVERGARSLILTSRSGVRTGYQARKIKYLQNLGVEVIVSSKNVCNSQEVCSLLTETNSKPVGGVFHLAMVLQDGFLENQDVESFMKVCSPKVKGTINLDKATRELCKESCHWFVVFSSVSCGRGNAGQSNYGFANSVMERICEERKQDGFAGLAVQWGAIGDVGIVLESMGDNDTVIGGTLPQRITSCLATLDLFLNQSEPVVSSFVLAEKQGTSQGGSDKLDLVFAVCHILGVSDPNTVDPDTSLGDLGLDSLMGVEVKQTLERGFDISMAMREIRQLTVNKLRGITSGTTENNNEKDMTETSVPVILEIQDLMPSTLIVELNDSKLEKEPIYIIHPIEGNVSSLREMSSKIGQPVFGVQCTCEVPTTTVHDMAQYYVQRIQHHNHNKPFHLAGYSFGACIAIEMALQAQAIQSESLAQSSINQSESQAQSSSNQSESPTQSSSNLRSLTLLDGSHKFVAAHTGTYREQMTIKNSAHAETVALCAFLEKFTTENLQMVLEQLLCASTFEERLHITVAKVTSLHPELAADNLKLAAKSFYQKLLISEQYEVDKKYDGDITLIVAEKSSSTQTGVLKKDYGLKQICLGEVKVHTVSGDHASFLQGDSGISVADVISNVTK